MDPELLVPLLAIGGGLLIPIVAIMAKHQRKMAELYRRNAQLSVDPRFEALQQDVTDLKDLVHRLTIAVDRTGTPLPLPDVQARVGE